MSELAKMSYSSERLQPVRPYRHFLYAIIIGILAGTLAISWWQRVSYESVLEEMDGYHLRTEFSASEMMDELHMLEYTLIMPHSISDTPERFEVVNPRITYSMHIAELEKNRILEIQNTYRGIAFEELAQRLDSQFKELKTTISSSLGNQTTIESVRRQFEATLLTLEQIKLLHKAEYARLSLELPIQNKRQILVGTTIISALLVLSFAATRRILRANEQASKELLKSEARFRAVVEGQTEFICRRLPDGTITFVNDAYCQFFGKTNEELIGRKFEPSIPQEDQPRAEQHLDVIGPDNPTTIYEHRVLLGEDKVRWLRWTCRAFFDDVGNPIEYQGVGHDITGRKRIENELRENEEKFRSIFDSANDGIFIVDRKSERIVSANRKAMSMARYEYDELLGMPISCLFPPEEQDRAISHIAKLDTLENSLFETQQQCQGGSLLDVEVNSSTVSFAGKKMRQILVRDISERKRNEKEKAKLEEQLQQSQRLETIGTLVGGIAHDFNNILVPIIAYSKRLINKFKDGDPEFEHAEVIKKSAERARDLIQQILLFSRQSQQEKRILMLDTLIEEAMKLLRPSTPSSIDFVQHLDEHCGKVYGDATQLHQVVVNLCANACHAMKGRNGTLSVELREASEEEAAVKTASESSGNRFVCLSIEDNGCGMDEATASRIFEPFFTTKKVNEGCGLGLSVVHGIIENHEGRIQVTSTPGEGSLFQIYLPITDKEDQVEADQPEVPMEGEGCIMLVDDDTDTAEAIRMILEELGYEIELFHKPQEAIRCFNDQKDRFDLVLTDLTMPDISGFELSKEIQKMKAGFPVVLMTGFGQYTDDQTLREHGIADVISKPMMIDELASVAQKHIGKLAPQEGGS